ncbi:protein kinase [Stenotrophomonas rhizophila]
MQRGKGGVYRAVDIQCSPARLCVVKEGRRHGETNWHGLDGRSFVEREEAFLRAMEGLPFAPPAVIDAFCIGEHRYLVMEHIDGEPLLHACADPQKKIALDDALAYAAGVAHLVAQLHAAGWVWRDLKPANLLVDRSGRLRPVDFEGALRADDTSDTPWGTPSYMPPEAKRGAFAGSHQREDLYGLGATIHQLLTSWLMHRDEADPAAQASVELRPALGRLRKGVPVHVRDLVAALMDADPTRRPSATAAADLLSGYARQVLPVPVPAVRDSAMVRRVREKMWKDVQEMLLDEPVLSEA